VKREEGLFKKTLFFKSPVISEIYANESSDLILGRSNIFSFFKASKLALNSTEFPLPWITKALSAGVERWFRQNDLSPTSSAQFSNEWSNTSPLLYAFMTWSLTFTLGVTSF
jgi:hypothetical protein